MNRIFVRKTYNRFIKIRKQPLVNAIVAYELYHMNCCDTESTPVSFLDFIEKEYLPVWKKRLIELKKEDEMYKEDENE